LCPPHAYSFAVQTVSITEQLVPELTRQQIIQIKSAAMEQRKWIRTRTSKIRTDARNKTDQLLRFKHPGGFAGAAELALMQVGGRGNRWCSPSLALFDMAFLFPHPAMMTA
jgi:hypothetical protein